MSMTELERRCYKAASDAIGADGCPTLDIVKAVLAEAGVADLRQTIAEAYHAGAEAVHKAWVNCGGNCPGDPDFWEAAHDYADSAKIGATQ